MKLKRLLSCFLALAMMTSMVSFQTSAYEGSSNNEGWNCKYHIVFAPKYRRKVFYQELM